MKTGKRAFEEPVIEDGSVGDHQAGVDCQSGDSIIVERLPTDVVIGDAGQAGISPSAGTPGSSNPA